MKIALCISGLPRDFKKSYPSLKEHILDKLNPDIFISTWDYRHTKPDPHSIEDGSLYPLEEFEKLYNPKIFEVETWDEKMEDLLRCNELKRKYDFYFKGCHFPTRCIPMYYKIWKAYSLVANIEDMNDFQYDVIIRARPDLIWLNSIPQSELDDICKNVAPDTVDNGVQDLNIKQRIVYIRTDHINRMNEAADWCHDQIYFSNSDVAFECASTYSDIEGYFKRIERPSPELLLNENFKRWGIEKKASNIRYKLARE